MSFRRGGANEARQRVIVLGAGEVGFNVADRLSREDMQVVLVDHNPDKLAAAQYELDVETLSGSASSPSTLVRAGAAQAGVVAAVTGNDEVNLLACLVANQLNPASLKLARLRNEDYQTMREVLGPTHLNITAVVNPDVEVVSAIHRMILIPRAVDYGEFGNGRIKIIAVNIRSGPLLNQPLTRFPEIVADRGVRVAGILRGERLFLPSRFDVVSPGDVVYFVCLEEGLAAALAAADARATPVRRICIVGGGDIGLRLATRLDGGGYRVKLVEKNARRCEELADRLTHVTVLHGDGTDRDFMREENMGGMDMAVALTGDEETNILVCLLAKSIGAGNTITRVNKNGYMPIVRAIGLELSVNPRLAATNSIVHILRKGMLLSTITTHDEDVEMLEAVVREGSALVGKELKAASFPQETNLLAVLRGDDAFIPRGDTVLEVGDRVIAIYGRDRLPWIESFLLGGSPR